MLKDKTLLAIILSEHWDEYNESLKGFLSANTSVQAQADFAACQYESLWRLAVKHPESYEIDKDGNVSRK